MIDSLSEKTYLLEICLCFNVLYYSSIERVRADFTDWMSILSSNLMEKISPNAQSAITCSKLTIETLGQGVKCVQS